MKDSQALRKTRRILELQASDFICHALYVCCEDEMQLERLRDWIISMLEGHYTLSAWLQHKDPSFMDTFGLEFSTQDYQAALRQHRIAWLDKLIRICESEGN